MGTENEIAVTEKRLDDAIYRLSGEQEKVYEQHMSQLHKKTKVALNMALVSMISLQLLNIVYPEDQILTVVFISAIAGLHASSSVRKVDFLFKLMQVWKFRLEDSYLDNPMLKTEDIDLMLAEMHLSDMEEDVPYYTSDIVRLSQIR